MVKTLKHTLHNTGLPTSDIVFKNLTRRHVITSLGDLSSINALTESTSSYFIRDVSSRNPRS